MKKQKKQKAKEKQEEKQEVFLVIGSNNFWYSMCETLKEAKKIRKQILKYKSRYDEGNIGYEDPESGHNPLTPNEVYIYKSTEII